MRLLGGDLRLGLRDTEEGRGAASACEVLRGGFAGGVDAPRLRHQGVQYTGWVALDGAHAQHSGGRDRHLWFLPGVRECGLEGLRAEQVLGVVDDVVVDRGVMRLGCGFHLRQHRQPQHVGPHASYGHRGGRSVSSGLHRRLGVYSGRVESLPGRLVRLCVEVLPGAPGGWGLPAGCNAGPRRSGGFSLRARLRGRGRGVAERSLQRLWWVGSRRLLRLFALCGRPRRCSGLGGHQQAGVPPSGAAPAILR
mmetsp:Transcript_41411/g.119201  ORF Transcript_41411/g.119201 Transcript_41411/m.119201 type:complete len:251 (-) Transcript_41411:49-801(-)